MARRPRAPERSGDSEQAEIDELPEEVANVPTRVVLVDLSSSATRRRKGEISPESAVIRLAMTETEQDEKSALKMIRDLTYRPGVTQVGANAEKLALKMRESAIVAAIAHGVIKEDTREKVAVSNAIRDIILQMGMVSPGLGGGYKLAIVRGDGRLSVCAFGRCGLCEILTRFWSAHPAFGKLCATCAANLGHWPKNVDAAEGAPQAQHKEA